MFLHRPRGGRVPESLRTRAGHAYELGRVRDTSPVGRGKAEVASGPPLGDTFKGQVNLSLATLSNVLWTNNCRSTDTEPSTSPAPLMEEQTEDEDILVKQSCHDSGIDIREGATNPIVVPISSKKVRTRTVGLYKSTQSPNLKAFSVKEITI